MFNKGDIVKIEWPSITNDVGGTTEVKGIMKARITDNWHDYETGYRFVGVLINKEDIERARQTGTTGKTPEEVNGILKKMVKFMIREPGSVNM